MAVLCVVVAAYIALFSAPSRVVGKKPAPRGVKYALCSNEFYVHAGFAICTGWAMNCGMLLLIWLLRDNGATAQQAGFVFIGMPVVLASTAVTGVRWNASASWLICT